MKLSSKLFLSIFFAAVGVSLILCSSIYFYFTKSQEQEFKNRFEALSKSINRTIKQFEELSEISLINAGYIIDKELVKLKKSPGNAFLERLAKRVEVSGIGVANKESGLFQYSTSSYMVSKKLNLFSFCEDYKNDLAKPNDRVVTPMLPSRRNNTSKFHLFVSSNGRYIVNIGYKVMFLKTELTQILADNPEVSSISVLSPTGFPLSEVVQKEEVFQSDSESMIKKTPETASATSTLNHENMFEFSQRVLVKNPYQCCECKQKGMVDESGQYFYKLTLRVSKTKFISKIYESKLQIIALFFLLTFISGLLSKYLSRKLLREVDLINDGLERITNTNDLSIRFQEGGSKEIVQLERNLNKMVRSMEHYQEELVDIEREKVIVAMNRQIAHDIRSPLSALQVLVHQSQGLPEASRVMLEAVTTRIGHIAGGLLQKNQEFEEEPSQSYFQGIDRVQIAPIVESIIREQKVQHRATRNIKIESHFDESAFFSFADLDSKELGRVVSNLISNSVDAINGEGLIQVTLEANDQHVILCVEDNGIGIRPDDLPYVFEKNWSVGKIGGNGLGLHHAKMQSRAWGSEIFIESNEGGTLVTLEIPRKDMPDDQYVSHLELIEGQNIVVVDDDKTVPLRWREHLKNFHLNLVYIRGESQLNKWLELNAKSKMRSLFLIDYHISSKVNGIDLIEKYGIKGDLILVTGSLAHPGLLKKCKSVGARYLYKVFLEQVLVHFEMDSSQDRASSQ